MITLYSMPYSGNKRKLVKKFEDIRKCAEYLRHRDKSPHDKYFNNGRGDIFYYGKTKIWEIRENEE